jgi:F-type H+-transporting ATPase subunit epsilon
VPVDVHIVTPEREVWSGEAEMVVARGVEGEVGILGGHAPLLIELAIGPLTVYLAGGQTQRAVIDGGFMHVTSGDEGGTRVDVLASQAELEGEIDMEAARRRADELRARLEGVATLSDEEAESGKAELKKALVRVGLAG